MKLKLILIMSVGILLLSCKSAPKNVSYFQDYEKITSVDDAYFAYEPTIKANDRLRITVSSPILDQTLVAQFNLPMTNYLSDGGNVQSAGMQTYRVNKDGYIDFPVLGLVKLEGLTRSEATDLLKAKISTQIANPIINLQIASFKVSVLGEVNRPGPISTGDERLSILDAIGAAGDLTIYGKRENILLIRDNNGEKEFHTYDLTKSDFITSPYFYLQQNDVIYIEPNDTKKKASRFGAAENFSISLASVIFSAVSVIATVISIATK
ncbi:polysaccharide export outer membrane protein [Dysgonomonadaceae bacterium PH5-43]|nr:polysaccharide export outer membrane protein [Dysgonomonadaceae bacterium PH5-43]